MQKQKRPPAQAGITTLAGIIIIVAVAVVLFGGVFAYQYLQPAPQPQQQLVGNDRDSHGCIGSAGYSWCEPKQKCLRTWEEPCETDQTAGWKIYTNTQYGFEIKYPDGYTMSEPDGLYSEVIFHKDKRTFDIIMTENCSTTSGADTSMVNINGINFTKYYESRKYSSQISTSAYKYCAVRGSWAYNLILRIESSDSFEADDDSILNQMLSTFKFTN